ncbi:hypothetical protein ACJQ40_001967 [Enterococcus faecium]|nr:hypothetical protein [Enterococcus faecium]
MENKTLKTILIVVLTISLIGNCALFWQLKEDQKTNTYKVEKAAQNASQAAKKISSQRAAEIDRLKQSINEKDQTIDQLKDQEGLKAKEEVTQTQIETAESFAKIAIDKSIDAEKAAEQLKPIASQEVIQKLQPDSSKEADHDYDTYTITLGEAQAYAQPTEEKDKQNFVVFLDYTVSNPQFKDVKPQKIKGGVSLTEEQVDGKWQVTDFTYFTRQ